MNKEQKLFGEIRETEAKDDSFGMYSPDDLTKFASSPDMVLKWLNIKQKKEFSKFIKGLVIAWVAFIVFMVVFSGVKLIQLSDSVLVALIAGTSVNIIGLIMIIVRHLFPSSEKTKCRNYEE